MESSEAIPEANEISTVRVSEPSEVIKYALDFPFREHNGVAKIIIHPHISWEFPAIHREDCNHEKVLNWKCTQCGATFQNFNNFLDYGGHTLYLEIKPLLQRFLNVSPWIYQSYTPANIFDCREYMMLILSEGLNLYEEGYKISSPNISKKIAYYLQRRYDNWQFYFRRGQPTKLLKFESMFECGNLRTAEAVGKDCYRLTLSPDTNASNHSEWFFFSVSHTTAQNLAKFLILNFSNAHPIFEEDNQIWIHSRKHQEATGEGWHRGGCCCHSEPATCKKYSACNSEKYYILTFNYLFEYDEDEVQFASCYPYPYTRMCYMLFLIDLHFEKEREAIYKRILPKTDPIDDVGIVGTPKKIKELEMKFFISDEGKQFNFGAIIYHRKIYARSLCGLPCYLITITSSFFYGLVPIKERQCVILTARVHASETTSNLVLEGFLRFILGDSPRARVLRGLYIFKIFPCLNPDGVVIGNTRTGLEGADLNRVWQRPNANYHPTIFKAINEIKKICEKKKIAVFCDFQSSNANLGSNLLGCPLPQNCPFPSWCNVQLLPKIFSHLHTLQSVLPLKLCSIKQNLNSPYHQKIVESQYHNNQLIN